MKSSDKTPAVLITLGLTAGALYIGWLNRNAFSLKFGLQLLIPVVLSVLLEVISVIFTKIALKPVEQVTTI